MPRLSSSFQTRVMKWYTHQRRWLECRRRTRNDAHFSVLRAWPFWVILGTLVIAYGAAAWHFASEERFLRDGDAPPTQLTMGTDLRIPESRISRGKLLLFEYGGNEDSRFVVRRASTNNIEVTLTACAHCYRQTPRPNYVLRGKVMCGMCRQPMRMPGRTERNSNRECEMVPVPYHSEKDEIVVPFEFVKTSLQNVTATGQR